MNNTASTNAQQQASQPVKQRKDWTKPVLDILELESAEHGLKQIPGDKLLTHLSA